ncbi:MAG TPA: coproporphyrinogen-III oxidase family protein, partial [Gemmatimonadales bacterium]|nr:coproporphyrinogen-III oxidase family protein [Gemmatimonadales bacterium]
AEAGVNRVSLGAQSFDPAALAWMHRTHDAAAIGAAVRTVRGAGIARLSLDLIFALPDQLRRDWRSDLDRAIALEPDHISLYGLTVEPGTALARWIARGQSSPVDEQRYEQEYLLAHEVLAAAGFEFYEVSNAARPSCEARHNRAYWQLAPYLGVGPAAHSFDGTSRWWNEAAYAAWLRRVNAGERPVAAREVLNPEQQRLERTYLALRTREGLELDEALAAKVEPWVRAGWAQVVRRDDGLAAGPATGSHAQESSEGPSRRPTAPRPYRLHLTPQGWLRLDELVATL